jgi:hypothetical protein
MTAPALSNHFSRRVCLTLTATRAKADSGDRLIAPSEAWIYAEEVAPAQEGDRSPSHVLAAKLAAIESAAAVGALSQREAASRCAALRAEHEMSAAHVQALQPMKRRS